MTSKHHRSLSTLDIIRNLNNTLKIVVSVTMVQRRLREYGLKEPVAARKSFLCKLNIIKGLLWGYEYKSFLLEQWS